MKEITRTYIAKRPLKAGQIVTINDVKPTLTTRIIQMFTKFIGVLRK